MSLSIGILGLLIRLIAVIKATLLFRYSTNYRVILLNVILLPFLIHPVINLGFSFESWGDLPDSILMLYSGTSILTFVSAHFVGYYIKQFTQTNKDIERRQEVFDQFINICPSLYFILVKDHIVYCNPATSYITGFSEEELVGMHYAKIFHPDCREHIEKIVATQEADSTIVQETVCLASKQGESRWINATFTSLLYNGEPALAASAQEITKQLISEKALLQAEERLRFAVEATNLVVWDYDPHNDKIHIETAPSVFPIKNYPEYFSFNSFLKYVIPQDRERVRSTAEAIKNRNTRFDIDFRIHTPTIREEWWHMEGRSFAESQDQPARIIGTSRCIDLQKKAQEALEKKEELIRFQANLLSTIGQAVIAQNTQGEVMYWNDAAKTLFGEIPEKELPINLNKYIPAEHRIINMPEIMNTLKAGNKWQGELQAYLLSSKVIPLYVTASPYTNKEGKFDGFIIVGTDLTDYKNIQSALEKSEERLRIRMNQLQIIYNMAEVMKEAENLHEIYRSAANGLFSVADINRLAILTYDPVNNPNFVYTKGLSQTYTPEALSQSALFKAHEQSRVIYISDLNNNTGSSQLEQIFEADGIQSMAVFPLVYHNNLLGKLVIFWDESITLSSNNKQILARIADQLAIGIIKKKTEIQLKQRTNELQTIADNIPDQIIRFDHNYQLLFANKASLNQKPYKDSHNMNLQEFIKLENLVSIWKEKADFVLQSGSMVDFEYEVQDEEHGNRRNYHALVIPEKSQDSEKAATPPEQSVLGIIRDTTENRQLQKSILDMSTRQQRKIGQDLHDELGQLLTGIGFLFAGLRQDLTQTQPTAIKELDEINALVEQAIAQTRILAEGLNPVTIELHGLTTSLERLSIHTEQLYAITCCFENNHDFTQISDEISYHIYRIAQEAITNSVKHSKASSVQLSLNLIDQKVLLTVQDDGVGFNPTEPRHGGQGLQIMKYRARMISGDLSIISSPDKGTKITCSIPYRVDK